MSVVMNSGAPGAIVQLIPSAGYCVNDPDKECIEGRGDCDNDAKCFVNNVCTQNIAKPCKFDSQCNDTSTGDSRCLPQGKAATNTGGWGSNGKITIGTVCLGDPLCFAKQFIALIGNVHDENRGSPKDGEDNNTDGQRDECGENPSFKLCSSGKKSCTSDEQCLSSDSCLPVKCLGGTTGCLMEYNSPDLSPGISSELCTEVNHDPDGDTEQSKCHRHSCWKQLGLEWPNVINVPMALPDSSTVQLPPLMGELVEFRTVPFDRFVAVVDRSGSMATVDSAGKSRIAEAVDGVEKFVEMMSIGSDFGIASFADGATKDFPLIDGLRKIATKDDRAEAREAARGLLGRAVGGTNIGAGLRKAHQMLLEDNGEVAHNSSVFLLTDGINNYPELDVALGELSSAKLPVFVSCIGKQARDSEQCANIADKTSGRFVDSPQAENLYDAFVDFIAQAEKNGIAQAQLGVPINEGELSTAIPIVVEPGTQEARFVISWSKAKSDLDLQLFRPDGTSVLPSELANSQQAELFRIANPAAGTWTMRVYGALVPAANGSSAALPELTKFSAHVLLNHKDVHVDAGLARSTIEWPNSFLVNASPLMLGRSIENCRVEATVQKPNGATEVVQLSDEGDKGDSKGHDGLYTIDYRNLTAGNGIYSFLLKTRCEQGTAHVVSLDGPGAGPSPTDPEVPTFERVVRFSGFVTKIPDNVNIFPSAGICHDVGVECQGPTTPAVLDGTCSADPESSPLTYSWTINNGSLPALTGAQPMGQFPLGHNTIELVVTDASGAKSSPDAGLVVVADTIAPAIQAVTATPSSLWPPNHHMAPVTLTVDAVEACDPSYVCEITSVTSNEKPECDDDGNPQVDWEITGPLSLKLRKEKGKKEKERIYTVSVTCTDASGNPSTADVAIAVEKPKGG